MSSLLTVGEPDDFHTGLLKQVRDYMQETHKDIIGNASPVLPIFVDAATAEKLSSSEAFKAALQKIGQPSNYSVYIEWRNTGKGQQPCLSLRALK